MSLEKLNKSLIEEVAQIQEEGRAKIPERIIIDHIPASGDKGPRYKLKGFDGEYIRMNSNSYLNLSNHPELIHAADEATNRLGVGPGAVRFIDGTFEQHTELEDRIAKFVNKPAARIFNSAYTSNLALSIVLSTKETYWIGDALNHNSIIRAMRIANIPRERRSIFKHNDTEDLRRCLSEVPKDGSIKRVCVIFDGIFSMRGDYAPIKDINNVVGEFYNDFQDGVITIVDDSHGIGAFGETGRGTMQYAGADADIIVGTFGKAFGVNGGFIAGSTELTEIIRQKADTYIYTNPLSAADCAAAKKAVDIVDSGEGRNRLKNLHERIAQFRKGIDELGFESIDGPHPVVPILVRDTEKTHQLVQKLFEAGILVVGLTFPVVPKGDETIRVQINAGLTESDIDYVLGVLSES